MKRNKLEIIKDILTIIKTNGKIKITPLLRKSNMSSKRFSEYFSDLLEKGFVEERFEKKNRFIFLTEKGQRYLEKYRSIISFIGEFDL